MPTCYQLIGVPGSGKTTWYKNQSWAQSCIYANTDQFVETYARTQKKLYHEVFAEYMPQAVNLMVQQVQAARAQNLDIIWDQTSTTLASRRKKFLMLPDYDHVAVVFKIPYKSELDRRLGLRPEKIIPSMVLEEMIQGWQPPTLEEGFIEIWNAE